MTKMIIKKGNTNRKKKEEEITYKKKCVNCDTLYIYQKEDIQYNCGFDVFEDYRYVICPNCGSCNRIWFLIKYKEK